MMNFAKRALYVIIALCLSVSLVSVSVSAASEITTTATGYTSASQVQYKIVENLGDDDPGGKHIANWGARGEDCVFLTTYANNYYTGNYTYEVLSAKAGGSSQSSAPSSALYSALKAMMTAKHKFINNYDNNRSLLKCTDCVSNDISKISSFYSGTMFSSVWDRGHTWNREHTWPNSKGLGGSDENDIMMIRPTYTRTSENSSRGNTAYGEGSGYYDPEVSVRGDCARIVLYVYTRWGNTSKMWGQDGVIESLDILLKWMKEDPVDTWEMGRNDAVQSITGVRNVFVDYPEYAFLLFGEDIPSDMTTPSGKAASSSGNSGNSGNSGGTSSTPGGSGGSVVAPNCEHSNTKTQNAVKANCKQEGYSGDIVCADCGVVIAKGSVTSKTDHTSTDGDANCDTCGVYTDNVILSPEDEPDTNSGSSQTTIGAVGDVSDLDEEPKIKNSVDVWVWVLLGGVVVVAIAATVYIVLYKRQKNEI